MGSVLLTMHATMHPFRWGEWLGAHADGLHLMLLAGHPEQISAIPPSRLAPLLSRGLRCLTLPQVGGGAGEGGAGLPWGGVM